MKVRYMNAQVSNVDNWNRSL